MLYEKHLYIYIWIFRCPRVPDQFELVRLGGGAFSGECVSLATFRRAPVSAGFLRGALPPPAPWMVLGGPAALAVRLLTAFLLARPSVPPPLPEKPPACECVCACAGACGDAAWPFIAGLFLGIALVCAALLVAQALPAEGRVPRRPRSPEREPRYRPRHAAGRTSP